MYLSDMTSDEMVKIIKDELEEERREEYCKKNKLIPLDKAIDLGEQDQ